MTCVTLLKTGETFEELKASQGCYESWFAQAVGDLASEWKIVDVYKGDPLPDPKQVDILIISGSAVSVYEYRPWSVKAGLWCAEIIKQDRPVLGVCYGHQLVIESLGGKVKPAVRGREMGAVEVKQIGDDPLFKGLDDSFFVWQTHIDEVALLPPKHPHLNIETIAYNDHCQYQGLTIGQRCRTIQWHPEMNQAIMDYYVQARKEIIDAQWGPGSAQNLASSLPSLVPSGPIIFKNFFEAFV